MRTHNEGGAVTGIEGTLMQIDPGRPKCQSLLIKLFTTARMLCIAVGDRQGRCRLSAAALGKCCTMTRNNERVTSLTEKSQVPSSYLSTLRFCNTLSNFF